MTQSQPDVAAEEEVKNDVMPEMNEERCADSETKRECRRCLTSLYENFPLGNIAPPLYYEGSELLLYSTTFSKILGIVTFILFLFYIGNSLNNFGIINKFNVQVVPFHSLDDLSKKYRHVQY